MLGLEPARAARGRADQLVADDGGALEDALTPQLVVEASLQLAALTDAAREESDLDGG